MSGSEDRKTLPVDLREFDTVDIAEEWDSGEVRPLVPMKAVPWLVMTLEQIRALPVDHRAGFILSLIDGRCSVEMILDMAGLPEQLALRILATLMSHGAIELRDLIYSAWVHSADPVQEYHGPQ